MFNPNQVVCLEGTNKSLFCEVIDTITSRSLCWVRPVLLVMNYDRARQLLADRNVIVDNSDAKVYDLRFTADLLWRISDFDDVLDMEYIEFFSQLEDFKYDEQQLKLAHQKLSYFVKELSKTSVSNK